VRLLYFRLCLLDFHLSHAPRGIELLLRLQTQLFKRLAQLGNLCLSRALHVFRMLLRGRA
jgi:hypothetical protein